MSIDSLAAQLKDIFADRLKMVAAFGDNASTCAVVQGLTIDDLDRCAAHAAKWNKAGLDAPLLIVEGELRRALDAFPLELSEIIATRRVVDRSRPLRRNRGAEAGPAARRARCRPAVTCCISARAI